MLANLGQHKILWFITGVLAFIAALIGVTNASIYNQVASSDIMPGIISQDLMTIFASIVIVFLAFKCKENDVNRQIVVLSIMGYLFYGYGIYVIERFYNSLYFLYLTIFALSFYSMVYGVASIHPKVLIEVQVSKFMRNMAVGFALFIPLLFYPMWITQILALIESSHKPEFMYSVYILDMCFVFPAFIILALMTVKEKGLGLLLIPVMFIKGFTLLFSVGLGGILKSFYYQTGSLGEAYFYLGIASVFLILTVFYFRDLRIKERG